MTEQMPESLPVEDVRRIVRLLSEVAELAGPMADRKRHLLAGLGRIVGADMWIWVQSKFRADGDSMPFSMIDGGWSSEEQRTAVLRAGMHPDGHALINAPVLRHLLEDGRLVTRTRDQLVSDGTWYGSSYYREHHAPCGFDHFIFSLYQVVPGTLSAIGMHRVTGAPAFGARERCIVHVVANEIDWLHREGTDVPAADRVQALSPRQREVLLLLLSGDGRKQVARKLGLSEHTVADHMKALHKHFKVSSRGELLSRFMSGGKVLSGNGKPHEPQASEGLIPPV